MRMCCPLCIEKAGSTAVRILIFYCYLYDNMH